MDQPNEDSIIETLESLTREANRLLNSLFIVDHLDPEVDGIYGAVDRAESLLKQLAVRRP